jgi:Ig-like domain from next to BRCA1 gene
MNDLTIPDGTRVSPGSLVDKRWQVENNGTCNWDRGYRLKLIAGPNLGIPTEQSLYPARSGTQPVIRIVFNAPDEAGTYHSAWQAVSPQGEAFGDPIFLEIIVASGG